MASVQEIYEQLLEDPNLDVSPNQTREEAAKIEAEYRARQYMNNVRALALATEPMKADTPLKALMNHLYKQTPPPKPTDADDTNDDFNRVENHEYPEGSGNRYSGFLRDGKPEGRGTMKFANGDGYSGYWLDGKRHTYGNLKAQQIYADGASYSGDWKDDVPNGTGLFEYAPENNEAGNSSYVGEVRNGVPHGQGSMSYGDGTTFRGAFTDGTPIPETEPSETPEDPQADAIIDEGEETTQLGTGNEPEENSQLTLPESDNAPIRSLNSSEKFNAVMTKLFSENWQTNPGAQTVAADIQNDENEINRLYRDYIVKPAIEQPAKEAEFKQQIESMGLDPNDPQFQNVDPDQHAIVLAGLKDLASQREDEQKDQNKEQEKQNEEQQKYISGRAQQLPVTEGFVGNYEKNTGKKMHPDLATHYLRLLRAHGEQHKLGEQSQMLPETQEKYKNAIREAIENGADAYLIEREYDEHGAAKAQSSEFIDEKHGEHLQREKHRKSLDSIISNPHHLKSAYYENMTAQGQTTDDIHLHGLSEPSELPHNSWHAWGTNQESFAQQEALHNIQHGNDEQRQAGIKQLQSLGIPTDKWLDNDESHTSNQPPDPEKAKELMAQGYEWSPETHHWHLREDVKKLHEDIATRARKNNNRARGAIIHGAKTNFDGKAFALHPDGSNSHEFFAAANGKLHRVGGVNFNKPVVNNHDVASHALGQRLNQAEAQNPGKVLPKPGRIKHHANLYDKTGFAYGTGMEQYLPKGRKETLNVRQRIETAAPTKGRFDAGALSRGLQESWKIFIGKGDFVSALELLHSQLELNQIALEKSKEPSIIK